MWHRKCFARNLDARKFRIIILVDGGWGEWSQWSKCNAKCPTKNGKQVKTRKCDNPVQENGGDNCVGKNKEEKSCKIKCCKSSSILIKLLI